VASVRNLTFITAVGTTSLSITCVDCARITIVTINVCVPASSFMITSIFGTSITIITTYSAGLTTRQRITGFGSASTV